MILSVHQPQYIPWIGYFDKIIKSDGFVFLDHVQYKAREFQNRNKIRTKTGFIWLTVPVNSKGLGRQLICDIEIDNSLPWARQHLLSLKSWYSHADFFKDYFPFFESTYSVKWERLIELNIHIINFILKNLSIPTPIFFESKLNISTAKTDRIIDICKKLKADTYFSGIGGKDYLEAEKFTRENIGLTYQHFTHPLYKQQFCKNGTDFLPYMSILDLIFNEGPKSREILSVSFNKEENRL